MGRGFGEHKRLARTDASKTLALPEIGDCPNPVNAYKLYQFYIFYFFFPHTSISAIGVSLYCSPG